MHLASWKGVVWKDFIVKILSDCRRELPTTMNLCGIPCLLAVSIPEMKDFAVYSQFTDFGCETSTPRAKYLQQFCVVGCTPSKAARHATNGKIEEAFARIDPAI